MGLPKQADFRYRYRNENVPEILVLGGHFPENTPVFENLNGTHCLGNKYIILTFVAKIFKSYSNVNQL